MEYYSIDIKKALINNKQQKSYEMADKTPKLCVNGDNQEPLINSTSRFTDKMLEEDFDELYKKFPLSDDTRCGYGIFQGPFLQK